MAIEGNRGKTGFDQENQMFWFDRKFEKSRVCF
jgi:hypothetical protein